MEELAGRSGKLVSCGKMLLCLQIQQMMLQLVKRVSQCPLISAASQIATAACAAAAELRISARPAALD
jgi:hypothetical protein